MYLWIAVTHGADVLLTLQGTGLSERMTVEVCGKTCVVQAEGISNTQAECLLPASGEDFLHQYF